MAVPHAQIRVHRYVSGWCGAARHRRCKGSYAGTACCCSCHREANPALDPDPQPQLPADPRSKARLGP